MNLLRNIVGGSRSDASANKFLYHHTDHDDDEGDDDEFIMVDSELPSQASYCRFFKVVQHVVMELISII